MSLKRSLYSLLLYLIFPLVLLRLLIRSRKNPNYRKRWSERLGFIKNTSDKSVIWLHAVSVGEVIAAKPLIEGMLSSYPKYQVLITTTTPTGSDRVTAIFSEQIRDEKVVHTYFPYDLLGSVSRFIKVFKPLALIVVETEIWPNLYAKCHQQHIPVVMVNARLSEKSTQSYLKIKGLVTETLSKVNVVAVRSKIDAKRFIQLGAEQDKVKEIGNIKYDIRKDKKQITKSKKYLGIFNKESRNRDLVFVAASTHKGEDEKIIFIFLSLLKKYPGLKLVLVPRHPERFEEVYEQCKEQLTDQLNLSRHSDTKKSLDSKMQKSNVVLGDSMGEMQMWFALADIAFIGGSLMEVGGHNPLEATLFGVPVVSGPHMFNFEDVSEELSASKLLFVCDDEFEIAKKVSSILDEKRVLEVQGSKVDLFKEKSEAFMQQHHGVTARLLKIIEEGLKKP